MTSISVLLRAWRAEHGWTQGQAAAALGVSLDTYQNWEQGRTKPAPEGPVRKLVAMMPGGAAP